MVEFRWHQGRWGFLMKRLGISAVLLLAIAWVSSAADGWAADMVPVKAPPASADSAPKLCTNAWDFIAADCQLTWQGITVFGTIDVGAGWQSHGAPLDPLSAVSASYLIQKQNNSPLWTLAPNALSAEAHPAVESKLRVTGMPKSGFRAS
jgi:hypothetical protein